MRATFAWVLLPVSSFALLACSHPAATCNPETKAMHSKSLDGLRSLRVNDAVEDAASAYASGDERLLGVYGFSVEVPGYEGDPYVHKNSIRMLEGTGDAFCTQEEMDLNRKARAYARKYNDAMLLKLGKAGTSLGSIPNR